MNALASYTCEQISRRKTRNLSSPTIKLTDWRPTMNIDRATAIQARMKRPKLEAQPPVRVERVVSLDDARPERWYVVRLKCRDCGAELNSTTAMTGNQLLANWGKLVIGSALVCKSCPNGCRATLKDININTEIVITQVEANIPS